MNFYHLSLSSSSFISSLLTGNFDKQNPKQQQILIVKNSSIQLARVEETTGALIILCSSEVFGIIRKVTTLRLPGSTWDYIAIGSDSGRVTVLEYENKSFKKILQETFGKSGLRRSVPGQYIAADPRGRAIMIGAVERAKFVYIFNRDPQSNLTISSPLKAHKNHTICMDIVGLDVGFENPLFCSIEVDFNESDQDVTGAAFDELEKAKFKLVFHELDLGLNHVLRKYDVTIPMTAHKLIQVPGGHEGPSGVLVCSEGRIEWYHVDCKPIGIVIPTRNDPLQNLENTRKPIIVASVVYRIKKQSFFILVQSDLGDVFKLTMDYQSENGDIGEVENIRLSYFETLPLATSLCLLKSAFMMLASEDGNHYVYQVANLGDDEMQQEFQSIDYMMTSNPPPAVFFPRELRNLVLVDTIESLSPLIDATVANLTEDDTPQIYALAGRGSQSTFRILRHGLEVSEIAATELPGVPNGIWTVRGNVADLYDSYIIISFVNATLVLSIGESVEEVTDTGVLPTTPTLSIGQLGQDGLVQIYPHGIRHIRSDRRVSEWKSPKSSTIVQGSSNLKQVCIGTSTNEICYFELDSVGNLNEYQDRKQMSSKIIAIEISPIPEGRQRGRYLAIACADNTVRIFSLDPNNCLEQVSMQGLSSPAESLVIIEAIDPATQTSSLFLNMGLANGVLIRTTIDTITGELTDTRQRFLGPKSVKLFSVTIANGSGVLCLSTRPWLSYTYQSATKLVPMSYDVLEYGSRFASEQSPEGIVGISGNTLRILSLDKLHQLFNQVSIKLKYTPRRLLLHPESKNFVVIEAENGVLCPSDMIEIMAESGDVERLDPEIYGYSKSPVPGKWASCIRFLNPFSGDTLSIFELDHNEAAVSLCLCRFLSRPDETLLVVGTVTGLVMNPKKFTKGGLRVYRFVEYGQKLELLQETDIDGIPLALCPFQGRLLVGVGHILRIYELGAKKLLRKCESRVFPRNIVKIHTQGERIITADATESYQYALYRSFDNKIVVFADDPTPRWLTSSCQLDYDTVAGGDKFGTIFVNRLDAEISQAIAEDQTGNISMFDRGKLQGAPHKLTNMASFFVGEGISSITKTAMVAGGRQVVVYTTFLGGIGLLVPFVSKEDVEFFQLLEMTLRQELPPLAGRNHLAYRSFYAPVHNTIDGDLCELFNTLPNEKKRMIAESLDRTVMEVSKKLDDIRNRSAF